MRGVDPADVKAWVSLRIAEALRAAGAEVQVLPVYETVPAKPNPACLARVVEGQVDVVVFTASSTVSHFEALLPEDRRAEVRGRIQAACIGPVTAQTAERLGYSVALVAETYTIPGVVEALVRWQQS